MSNKCESSSATIAVIIASFLWGTTGVAASFSENVSPLAIGAFSMGVAGLLLMLFNFSALRENYCYFKSQRKLFLLATCSVAVYPLAFYCSMHFAGVGIGTIVSISSAPIFAACLERLFSQKLISIQWWLSCFISVIGVTLLTISKVHPSDEISPFFEDVLGVLLGCIAGLAYACYSWIAKCFIEKGVDARAALSGIFAAAACILLPSLMITGNNLFSNITNSAVAIYMALIPMFLGYVLFSHSLKYMQITSVTLITLIEPLVAMMLATLLLGETFKMLGWLGAMLVFVGLIFPLFNLSSE